MSSCFGPFHRGLFGSTSKKFRRSLSSASSSKSNDSVRDLDIDCMLQTAKNLQEYDLEQKIGLELKMQEGTTKLLAACKYQLQSLEAAKSLLTSNERINTYMFELHKKKDLGKKLKSDLNVQIAEKASKGKIAISDIRMPLIWKDSDHFKNKGDYRKYAVFCLFKVGAEVYDSVMVTDVDRSMTDIAFEDVIVFNHVLPDFEFTLEVYSHILHEDLTIGNASDKLKKKLSCSVSRTIGKKLISSIKDDMNNKLSGPEFDLVAHASLSLKDSNARIKTYDFVVKNLEKTSHQLPLFGHFCCRMAVQPGCMVEETYSGYLNLVQKIGNITGSRRMWSSLKNFSLSMWVNAADIHCTTADVIIPIKKGTNISSESNKNSYPQFSFKLKYLKDDKNLEFLLATDTYNELSRWMTVIEQHMNDYDLWKPASDSFMEIPSPGPCRNSAFIPSRNSSLYDEIPLSDYPDPSSPGHDSVFQKNSNRLSTPSFCSWSSSSSSTSGSLTNNKQQISVFRRSTCGNIPF